MRKIYLITLLVLVFTSCNKDFDTMNDDQKSAGTVPASTLFSNATRELVDNMTTPSVNINIFRLLSQQWAETTYADETQNNLTTRNIPRNFWNPMYRDVLKDFSESKRLLLADQVSFKDPKLDPKLREGEIAVTEILSCYAYSVLVGTFGDIPYTEALNNTIPRPKYDAASSIYDDLIKRLDAAIASLSAMESDISDEDHGDPSFAAADLIYGASGDLNGHWIKFANSLKLRIGMTLADADAAKAKTIVESAAAGVFTSNDDNAMFAYLSSPPNTNPLWVNLIQSQRVDFVASNTIVDIMNPLNDPRLSAYFNTLDGAYLGGEFGAVNSNSGSSLPSDRITAKDFPGDILDYAEVEFYLAEAAERGFTVDGTAAEHYDNAVTASILFWGGTDADAALYLSKSTVAYGTAAGDFKQKIGTQKWIAMYNRGFEAWTEYRRLDFPVLNEVSPDNAQGPFPLRFPYSDQEVNLNVDNYKAAVAKIPGGKDVPDAKLFWDKF